MPKNLVIVESPAKAKTIEKFLGDDYKVMSSYGHIRDLKKKNFGVDLDTFAPDYEIPADKQHVVSELRSAAKKASAVWLASDEDREGEAISWHLAEVLGIDPKTAQRIVFHEITKPAILAAIEHPRSIDLNLVDAQQARRVLDRLVGFKVSPVLWRRVRPSLSAGRVQSVAVRLIVEREREIAAFKEQSAYRVSAVFTLGDSGKEVRAELDRRFKTKAEAEAFLLSCNGAAFHVAGVETRPMHRTPAPPFTTSTLQQEAARKLGFSVSATMRVAQTLYEAGLITYMRTDSTNLSALCLNACGPVIEESMGKEYHKRRTYHTHTKGAQEAHEAIRPTDMRRAEIEGTAQERRLYALIRKRTLACQMADALIEKTTAVIAIDGKPETFVANGEVVKFDGFLRVYADSRFAGDGEGEDAPGMLPQMSEGETACATEISARERFSAAPARYNEASLVHKLEELGIGRPSTYAPTISTIQQRGYVAKGDKEGTERPYTMLVLADGKVQEATRTETVGSEKGKLMPTDVGLVVNDFLLEAFPGIMDYNFTANVEKEFDEVAEGKKDWKQLIQSFYKDFEPDVERSLEQQSDHKVGERSLGIDPASGKPVVVKIGRFGPMAQIGETGEEEKPRFARLAAGQSIETITLEEALDLFKLPRVCGAFEGKDLVVSTGRFGPYVMHDKKFVSIPKNIDPLEITQEQAINLIVTKRNAEEQSILKTFEEQEGLQIRTGRFGPYIACNGKNFKIPRSMAERAAELTIEECRKIMSELPKKKAKK
ncbi:MAG: type I DNA topoisomerase [Bacteroidales bacterium]|nr:type I DNA topoisomerase [Bacteroidales bacterium]